MKTSNDCWDLSFDKVLEIAVSQDAAAQNVQTLCGMRSRGDLSMIPSGPPMESINPVKSGKQRAPLCMSC